MGNRMGSSGNQQTLILKEKLFTCSLRDNIVKPTTCTQCDKTFSDLYSMKVHESVHTVQKPHSCSHCDKTFKSADSLKIHGNTHISEFQESAQTDDNRAGLDTFG